MSSKWYAIYTKPRWEKKVSQLLTERGIENYCPLNKVRRKWSDRMKTVEEPLFKSYVFVHISDEERTPVRMVGGVINFVYWDNKLAVIKDKEILTIKKFLNEFENVQVEKVDVKLNEEVRVTAGPLMDKEGRVLEVKHKVVKILIESLGYELTAYVEKTKIESLPPKSSY